MTWRAGTLLVPAALLALTFAVPSRPASNGELAKAEQQFDAGNYAEAIQTIRGVLTQNANDAAAHYWLGRCYYELRDYDNAVAEEERATLLAPKSSLDHQWLGRAYGEKADRDRSFFLARKVKKEFELAVELDPSNLSARRDLEDYLLEAPWIVGGSKDDALAQVNAISALDPLAGHLARADYWSHLGNKIQAEAEYRAALGMKPRTLRPYLEVADFYIHQGNGSALDGVIRAAAAVDSKDPRLSYYRGVARVVTGTGQSEAEEDLKSYLASSPDRSDWPSHAAAREWLGQLYEREGKRIEAAEQYRAALQLDPGRKLARKRLEQLEKSFP